MLSTVPPQNLLEVAERLESEGRPHIRESESAPE